MSGVATLGSTKMTDTLRIVTLEDTIDQARADIEMVARNIKDEMAQAILRSIADKMLRSVITTKSA